MFAVRLSNAPGIRFTDWAFGKPSSTLSVQVLTPAQKEWLHLMASSKTVAEHTVARRKLKCDNFLACCQRASQEPAEAKLEELFKGEQTRKPVHRYAAILSSRCAHTN